MRLEFYGDVRTTALAVTLGAVAAGLSFIALAALTRPAHLGERLAAIGQIATKAERLKAAGGSGADPHRRACHTRPEAAMASLAQALSKGAAAAKIDVSNIVVAPSALGVRADNLTMVDVRFHASGSYDALITLLGLLSKSQPEIFLDTADLRSRSGAVDFDLKGHVYCSTSAHL
jgi:hypothetical protein